MVRKHGHLCRGLGFFAAAVCAGMGVADVAQAQPRYSQDGHYQDHRGSGARPPRLPGYNPRAGHYQDHRNDPPAGPRSPGYQNPYLPRSGGYATPPRGPTVGGDRAPDRGPTLGGSSRSSSGRR